MLLDTSQILSNIDPLKLFKYFPDTNDDGVPRIRVTQAQENGFYSATADIFNVTLNGLSDINLEQVNFGEFTTKETYLSNLILN